jgi:hypothetical protein
MGEYLPWLYRLSIRFLMAAVGSDAASIDKRLARSAWLMGEPDREVLQNAQTRRLLAKLLPSALVRECGGT